MNRHDELTVPDELLRAGVWDERFRALAEPRRRCVLGYLLERERATLSELGDVVTGCLATREEGVGRPAQRERVLLSLHHVDLPMLDDASLLEYDAARAVASLGPAARDNQELLRALFEQGGEATPDTGSSNRDERNAGG